MPFLRQILEGGSGRPLQHDAHHSGTLAFNNLGFTCNKMQQELQMRQARLQVIIVLVFLFSIYHVVCWSGWVLFSNFPHKCPQFCGFQVRPTTPYPSHHPAIQPSSHRAMPAPRRPRRSSAPRGNFGRCRRTSSWLTRPPSCVAWWQIRIHIVSYT